MVLDLQVDPKLEEERDARLFVPAQARDPGVCRVLKHLVCGPRLSSVEAEIDVRLQHAGGDSVRQDRPIVTGESPELLILDVADRAHHSDRREVDVLGRNRLRHGIGAARATRDVGALSFEMWIQHQDPILRFREADEVPAERLRNLSFRRNVMVRDDRVKAVQRVQHPGAEVDEPDERRPLPLQIRDDGVVEFLDEGDFV